MTTRAIGIVMVELNDALQDGRDARKALPSKFVFPLFSFVGASIWYRGSPVFSSLDTVSRLSNYNVEIPSIILPWYSLTKLFLEPRYRIEAY